MSSDIKVNAEKFGKMYLVNRYFLLGKGFFSALEAMEYAFKFHGGKRKDGSPEFSHQLSQAQFAQTILGHLLFPEETFSVIYLHDTTEDTDATSEDVMTKFGDVVAEAVLLLDKHHYGRKLSEKEYYKPMADNPIASIVKGLDRVHNFYSMSEVFTKKKKIVYMAECRDYILPMLKSASKNFPSQTLAYNSIRYTLKMQIEIISAGLGEPTGF